MKQVPISFPSGFEDTQDTPTYIQLGRLILGDTVCRLYFADPRLLLGRKDNCTALAQHEQEEPLPLVDIGVDVTPEGTHVVACYNRPDAVQEMFYSQFHPLTKPEQEPVCDKDPSLCGFTLCQLAKVCKHTPRNTMPIKIVGPNLEQILNAAGFYRREWVGLTQEEVQEIAKQLIDDAAYCSTHFAIAIEAELRRKNNG